MKFRKDFVTNSSSSSFVCEICGNTESGFDLSYRDAEMFVCMNDHTMCNEHMLDVPREKQIEYILKNHYKDYETGKEYTREELDALDDEALYDVICPEGDYDVPDIFCPICQFEEYSKQDMASYLLTHYKVSKGEAFAKIKEKNKRRRKLYDYEYIEFVTKKFGLVLDDIKHTWKRDFKSYSEFSDSLTDTF